MSNKHADEIFMLKAVRYRVQNFRNIDDSGCIPLGARYPASTGEISLET